MNRREFLAGAGSFAVASTVRLKADAPLFTQAPRPGMLPASIRQDFPSVLKETYLNSASMHPVGTFAADAAKKLIDLRTLGPGNGADFNAQAQQNLKAKFGALINAKASEIAYTGNTTDGENIVVMGLDLAKAKGSNIVIDELHFTSSLYMYKELEKKGVEDYQLHYALNALKRLAPASAASPATGRSR